ncbi:MAG: caspase family protein [Cyanobacteria bacterium P01_D01_bin.105]
MALHCIVTGTGQYKDETQNLPTVEADVASMVEALTSLGYSLAEVPGGTNPSREALLNLEKWFEARDDGDDVIVHYVGHGKTSGWHSLQLSDGNEIATLNLIGTFAKAPKPGRILLILDTCESGRSSMDFDKHWPDFKDQFIANELNLTLVTSCRDRQEAKRGKFTPALAESLLNRDGRFGGKRQKYLYLPVLLEHLSEQLPGWQTTVGISYPRTNDFWPEWEFPNPLYDPQTAEEVVSAELDVETQRKLIECQAHWDECTHYFIGRQQALEAINTYLESENAVGALAVTGDPGAGKSAVLANVVLSEKCIDVPIHSKNRDLEQLLDILSNATRLPLLADGLSDCESRSKALAESIGKRGEKLSIVIDALDEAVEPLKITRSLLSPLAKQPCVRLVIGTRPSHNKTGESRFQRLGSSAVVVDLDRAPYYNPQDIENYARMRLLESGPYCDSEALAAEAASAIARKAGRTFLIAKLECDGLVKGQTALTAEEIWDLAVPIDVKNAFSDYLDRFEEGKSFRIQRALTALAFSFGQGLPHLIWEKLAPLEDIYLARKEAAAYIVESLEDRRSVYRLFHEKFAEFLREREGLVGHERFLDALWPNDWFKASLYVRRYLAFHAAAVSRLDELVASPSFLVAVEPSTMRQVAIASTSAEAIRFGHVYSVCAHLLGADLQERAAVLAMAAMKCGYLDIVDSLMPFRGDTPWWPRVTRWQPSAPHFKLDASNAVRALAVGSHNGVPILASGGDDGVIELWNLETLERFQAPFETGRWITALALHGSLLISETKEDMISLFSPSSPFEPTLSKEPSLLGWDLNTRAPLDLSAINASSQDAFDSKKANALGLFEDQCIAAFQTSYGFRFVNVLTGAQIDTLRLSLVKQLGFSLFDAYAIGEIEGDLLLAYTVAQDLRLERTDGTTQELCATDQTLLSPGERLFNSLAIGTVKGRDALVAGSSSAAVRVWDAHSFEQIATFQDDDNYVDAVALGERNGIPIAISGSRSATIRILHILSAQGADEQQSASHNDTVCSMSLCEKTLASTSWDRTLRLWHAETMTPEGSPISLPSSSNTEVCLGRIAGRQVLLTGNENTLEIKDLQTLETLKTRSAEVSCIVIAERFAQPVIVTGNDAGIIEAFDAVTLEPLAPKRKVQVAKGFGSMGIQALQLTRIQERPCLASAGGANIIELWELETLRPAVPPLEGHESVIYSLASGQIDGRTVLASCSFDRTVRLWDLQRGSALGSPLEGHQSPVYAIAIGTWKGEPIVCSGDFHGVLKIWDLKQQQLRLSLSLDSKIHSLIVGDDVVYAGCGSGIVAIDLC